MMCDDARYILESVLRDKLFNPLCDALDFINKHGPAQLESLLVHHIERKGDSWRVCIKCKWEQLPPPEPMDLLIVHPPTRDEICVDAHKILDKAISGQINMNGACLFFYENDEGDFVMGIAKREQFPTPLKVYWFGGAHSCVYGGALVCAHSIEEARKVLEKEEPDHFDEGQEMPMLYTNETEPKVILSAWDCC